MRRALLTERRGGTDLVRDARASVTVRRGAA